MPKMTHTEFCHWLNGYVALTLTEGLNQNQWNEVKKRLAEAMAPEQIELRFTDGLRIGVGEAAK